MIEHMLTTVDNPFDPFTQFAEWDRWDRAKGYCCSAYLARVVKTSDELCEADQMQAVEQGIDDILRYDPLEVYKKVSREVSIDNRPSSLVGEPE